MTPSDKILIEARDYSVRLEKAAFQDLEANVDEYCEPSWTLRKVVRGYGDYATHGKNTDETYLRFREAYTETRGKSNQVFSNVIADHIGKTEYDYEQTMFDLPNEADLIVRSGLSSLRKRGFYKTKLRVPAAKVKSLHDKILSHMENDHGGKVAKAIDGTDDAPLQIKGVHSWVATLDELYEIAADPVLLGIVQSYMGVPPIFNTPVCFLNSARQVKSQRELSDTAQLYHHDLHRLQFVKMFVYLTDVDANSGPHTLIQNTHRTRPGPLWADGRHTDEAVAAAGLADDEVNITGPAGTVFLVDTSALHKGANPISKHRLMAQVQYTNSLFGRPWSASERKVTASMGTQDARVNAAADLARHYAAKTGVRFMQNYI